MVLSFQRLQHSFKEAFQLLRQHWPMLLFLQLVNFFFTQSLSYLQALRMTSKEDGYILWMVGLALAGFIAQSVIKVVWTLIVCGHFSKQSHMNLFVVSKLEESLIESLRAFFRATLYGFLLIIPGLIKMVRYQFVIFIVGDNKNYSDGQLDALKGSAALTKGHFFSLVFLLFIFMLPFIPMSTNPSFFEQPVMVTFFEIISFYLIAVETTYLYKLYRDLQAQQNKQALS